MKRLNNIYAKIYTLDNLELADKKARKGKSRQYGVILFDQDRDQKLLQLQKMLIDKTYKTSPYSVFKIYEPKEREIYRLPYYPDRIAQHAAMNILEPVFTAMFTADTYSCIKGKGIHGATNNLKIVLKDIQGTKYCLKLDIKKFYPNVDHEILKQLLRRKFKDQDLLSFLDEIVDSAPGIPIGNYLSQYFANFYLTGFDHWLKESKKVKYYFRYADDIVILSSDKNELHHLLGCIKEYLSANLKLAVKENYQIFPVAARGIDFLGYVFRHIHIRIRKTIKKNFAKMLVVRPNPASIASYNGWIQHSDGKHLLKKLINS